MARWASTSALVVLTAALAGGAATGGAFNPARSLAASIISGCFDDAWVYWVAPLAGALVGGVLQRVHARVLLPGVPDLQQRPNVRSRASTIDSFT